MGKIREAMRTFFVLLVVLFGTVSGSPSSGSQLWNFTTGDEIQSTCVVSSDGKTVFVGSEDEFVYALKTSDGSLLWKYRTHFSRVDSSPTLSLDGNLYALKTSDGTKVWNYMTLLQPSGAEQAVTTKPILTTDGQTLFFGAMDYHVYALKTSDGSQIWNYTAADCFNNVAIAPDGQNLYASSADHNMYALKASDGSLVWKVDQGKDVQTEFSDPVVSSDNQALFVGSEQGIIYALKTSDGSLIWNYTTEGFVFATPTL